MTAARRPLLWLASRVVTVVVTTFLIFTGLSVAPGDPVRAILGGHATKAAVTRERHVLGLDKPLLVRYWDWLSGAVHGQLGTSIVYKTSVSSLIGPRIGTTLLLVLYSLVIILVVGLALGIAGGMRRSLATPVSTISGVLVAVPAFVAAQLLVIVFALWLGWFPVSGAGSGLGSELQHLTLPSIALALGWSAWVAQVTRTAVAEAEASEFVDTARGRGISSVHIFRRHVLRNAAAPIVTVSGLTLAGLFAGAVVVEDAFALNGLGTLLINSVSAKDYSVVLAVSAILVVIFVLVTSMVDALHLVIDPRIRDRRAES